MRVLVVDADAADRAVTCGMLDGHEVEEAGSVATALAARSSDVVVASQEVANELAAALRRTGEPTPVLCILATDDDASLAAALSAGVTDVLHARDRTPRWLALRLELAVRVGRAETAARRATAARDDTLSIVSHDLRGPLHAIGLATEALRDDVPEGSRRFLGAIDRAAARAEHLIAELLEASAIENGVLELDCYPVDAAAIIRQATADHEPQARESGGAITATLPVGGVVVSADRERVLQVLGNLIGNALKHARGAPIEISVERGDTAARIAVRDRGPGIPEAVLPQLLDRYARGRPKKGGAGLGLAIAKGIVAAHGGELAVRNAAGGGAELSFTLPLAVK